MERNAPHVTQSGESFSGCAFSSTPAIRLEDLRPPAAWRSRQKYTELTFLWLKSRSHFIIDVLFH